jgi:hypothetical protein
MASRDLQKRGNGSIKLTAFCVFIFCCGLVFRQQYELPGFANYHQSTDEPREHGRGSMAADSWQEPATSMQTTEYISSSSSNNINNNSDQQAVTLGKNPRELGPEIHAQEDRLFEVKRFLQTEKNSPAADQQLVVDHDLGDLHDKEKEEEEEGEFRSTNSVKSKPMMSADHQEQTEEFTAVIETDSADDEDDEGSWTEGLNAHEMYTTDSAPDEQDGGEMSDSDDLSEDDQEEEKHDQQLAINLGLKISNAFETEKENSNHVENTGVDLPGTERMAVQSTELLPLEDRESRHRNDITNSLQISGLVDDETVDDDLKLISGKDTGAEDGFQETQFSRKDDKEPDAIERTVVDEENAAVQSLNRSGINLQDSISDWNLPRAIPRNWEPTKQCATAEEMGAVTAGDTRAASLRVRHMIQDYLAEYGRDQVAALPGEEFCKHAFVLGQAQPDGFGNNMYKVLSAAGLAIMLNRSLIIGERGATNPAYIGGAQTPKAAFGDYLNFSNQTFTMKEVKHLWAIHQCAQKYKRPLVMHVDRFEFHSKRSARCLCDDWTNWTYPIIWFKGTTDTIGLQFLLKNAHSAMRSAAAKLFGNPSLPNSRPNTFGELFRAFITPNADIQEAVEWALKGGPEPDIALHLRMLHRKTSSVPIAAASCINHVTQHSSTKQTSRRQQPRVVVVSDTPAIYPEIKRLLGQSVEVIQFNYVAYLNAARNLSDVMSLHKGEPPRNRIKDWGGMPRWVAVVDFFLAARAQVAVVSGAYRRVSTTYAQLVAALAAANSLDESEEESHPSVYYSSFQQSLVVQGLASQAGWGYSWRPFGGRLGCKDQVTQCAATALLPYAWWDAPWQSPLPRDFHRLKGIADIDETGQISELHLDKFCATAQKRPLTLVKLMVPTCTKEIPCE